MTANILTSFGEGSYIPKFRQIFHQGMRFRRKRKGNKNTLLLVFLILFKDFFNNVIFKEYL